MRRAAIVLLLAAAFPVACTNSCKPTITTARDSGAVIAHDALSSGSVTARLVTEKHGPLELRSISFTIKGDDVGSATTNGQGIATLDLKKRPLDLAHAVTAKTFEASFLGDFGYCGSNGEAKFRIVKR
ncbi:MAG: hypothetical protein ABR552_11290 [Actinomycetota bacterium]|nr:hypothetical protein [Actinomycetota bacterium]